jgi:hypothetical protein
MPFSKLIEVNVLSEIVGAEACALPYARRAQIARFIPARGRGQAASGNPGIGYASNKTRGTSGNSRERNSSGETTRSRSSSSA